MKGILFFFILLFLLFFQAPSPANDSVAAMEAGGLVLKKSDGIVMESEDLFLSLNQVRVRYIFRNITPAEIRTLVAFPIGKWTYEINEKGDVYADPELTKNIFFKATVEGKPVATQVDRKIEKRGKNYLDTATYYWEQVFPPGQKMEVTHTYQPGVGGFFFSPTKDEYGTVKEYCIDPPLLKSLAKHLKKKGEMIPATTLHYVLSTGSNWKGPIQNFRLILDKGKPETLVSLCIDGIRKISPTQFEMVKKNFTPKKDLQIVFFKTQI